MSKRIRLRLIIILFVAAISLGLFAKLGINCGLDLRGGVNLVLQVVTDDAVRNSTDHVIQSLVTKTPAERVGNDQFRVTSGNVAALIAAMPEWEAVNENVARLRPAAEDRIRTDATTQTIRVIRNRLDKLGVGEVDIQSYGNPNEHEILIRWPGAADPDRVKEIIKATAILELKLVDSGPFQNNEAAVQNYSGTVPPTVDVLPEANGALYAVQKTTVISGADLKSAFRAADENGRPAVGFNLTTDGARLFGEATEQNIGKSLAVVLDGRIQSVARIDTRISDSGVIRGGAGGFTVKQVDDLALVLNAGALPASVTYLEDSVVGPSLGAESIRQGSLAAGVALAAVVAFMLWYYRWAGVNAMIAMVLNLAILLGSMAYFRATLTLPGIAGFILTIGVGIDSNVLIFERIREELRAGHPAASSVSTAFRRVFITLVDTHLAALISAAFLFVFGTGPIQGFAVTLSIGLVSNMFTSVFVSRTLFEWTLSRHASGATLSI